MKSFIWRAVKDAIALSHEEFCSIGLHVPSSFTMETLPRMYLKMPVFRIELLDGTVLTLRYNFHDWVVSINSPEDVEADFMDLFDPKEQTHVVPWEGSEACLYGPYAENRRQFTVALDGHYRLYTFFWILAHHKKRRTP